ncbi:transposase [Streptomyces sp. NRAIS4]
MAAQYCGALDKRANCLGAVGFHAASDTAFCPLQWRLFLPEERVPDIDRRTATRVPPEVTHRERWRSALDMLDTLADWGMRPPVVVADAAYGTNAHLRVPAVRPRNRLHAGTVRADVTAHPYQEQPVARPAMGPSGVLAPAAISPARTVGGEVGRQPRTGFLHHPGLAAGLARGATYPLRCRGCPPRGQGRSAGPADQPAARSGAPTPTASARW